MIREVVHFFSMSLLIKWISLLPNLLAIKNYKSIILVAAQFIILLILLCGTSFHTFKLLPELIIAFALLLAFWAIATMSKTRLRIFPEPAQNAILITSGPYKYIRHPMYTALIIACTGLVIADFTWIRLCLLVTICVVLIIKLLYEEELLTSTFTGYIQYKKNTFRLFPFIF